MSRLLVTGSGGATGYALKRLVGLYPEYEFIFSTSKDCNLVDRTSTFDFIRYAKPDRIIHLAAVSGGIELSKNYQATLLHDNVMMTLNILEASREFKVKKILMMLSSGMYPENAPMPYKEEDMHNGLPNYTNYSYAFAKRLIEPAIWSYSHQYDMNIVGAIPNGIYGEGDNFSESDGTMLPSLIRRFYNKDYTVWGTGEEYREYTYAKDIAKICMLLMNHYNQYEVINIGNTHGYMVKEYASKIANVLHTGSVVAQFKLSEGRGGAVKRSTDNSKFMNLFPEFKYTDIDRGLSNTIKWFKDNYPNVNMKGKLKP